MRETGLLRADHVGHVHLVGIGGIGLSAIARVLKGWGYQVSGSDALGSTLTAELVAEGIAVSVGHDSANVSGADLVVRSSAVPESNPEIRAARAAGIPVLKRAQLLGDMMVGRFGIAVAGTHGKTTTSAMISHVLLKLGYDPTFIVGGVLQDWESNARVGRGPHFVIEADEYDRTFLGLKPRLEVVTMVEMDHPDCFADIDDVGRAFEAFTDLVPDDGFVIGCADQPRVVALLERARQSRGIRAVGYGLTAGAWQATGLGTNSLGGSDFTVLHDGQPVGRQCRLQLPGVHNVSNCLAALTAADSLGVDVPGAMEVLQGFRGVRRRFELKGQANAIVVIDDYAHHPTEIKATLAAARRRYGPRPIWAFFQPHTYSRTKSLMGEFAGSFDDADHVLVADIYAARENDDLGVSAQELVQRMVHLDARYVGTLQSAVALLSEELRPGDILLTLGAGDGYKVGEQVLDGLSPSGARERAR